MSNRSPRKRISMRTLAKMESQRTKTLNKPKPDAKSQALRKAYEEWGRM